MKKFTKIVENIEESKYFKIKSEIEMVVKSNNEGEAAYISDSILSSIKGQSGYNIKSIEEVNQMEIDESVDPFGRPIIHREPEEEMSQRDIILKTWEAEFGDRKPTTIEKMEFYRQLRNAGIDGILIFDVLKNKI
jgi:hypothetical protein